MENNEGYRKELGGRQTQMIAISLTIGVGLFLGTGGRLQAAGPALILSYVLAGVAAFFVMRAVGELVLYRQTCGGFVEYAREFIGPWAGFAIGWTRWFGDVMAGIAQATAVSIYVRHWFPGVPQWVTATAVLATLLTLNLLAVKLFGEVQYWLSMIKVLAIVAFLGVGLFLVFTDPAAGPHNLTELAPNGLAVVVLSVQAALFAYAGVESVAVAAGETKDPRRNLPKVINRVSWQISVFYLGSLLLLVMVLPWTAYGPAESPFVTVFSRLGIPAAADVMNLIVLTAALSASNSGLYANARTTRALALRGETPAVAARMNKRGVPAGAVLLFATASVVGIVLNYLVPSQAFEIAVSAAALSIVAVWATYIICQLRLRSRGHVSAFRMPGAPYSGWFVLGLLGLVLCLLDATVLWCIPVLAVGIAIGSRVVSTRRPVPGAPRIP